MSLAHGRAECADVEVLRRRRQGTSQLMGITKIEITGTKCAWRVRHYGRAGYEYATREAFQATIAAVSHALREGYDVTVTAPSSQTTAGQ